MKKKLSIWNDIELTAKSIGICRGTYSVWRVRGYVPPKWWHSMEIESDGVLTRDELWEIWNKANRGRK